jgi:hypothetical protein
MTRKKNRTEQNRTKQKDFANNRLNGETVPGVGLCGVFPLSQPITARLYELLDGME